MNPGIPDHSRTLSPLVLDMKLKFYILEKVKKDLGVLVCILQSSRRGA